MKNLLLSFICLMLCAPLCTKAQVNVSTSEGLKNAFTEYGKIADCQVAYDDASAEVVRIQNQMAGVQPYIMSTTTETVYDELCSSAYMNYDAISAASTNQLGSLYLYLEKKSELDLTEEGYDEYFVWLDEVGLDFDEESMRQFLSIDGNAQYGIEYVTYNVYPIAPAELGLNVNAVKTKVTSVFSSVRKNTFSLCYRAKVGSTWTVSESTYDGAASINTFKSYISVVKKLQGDELTNSAQTTTTTTSVENPVYTKLQEDLNEAKAAQTSANNALLAVRKYNEISIVASFSTDAYVNEFGGSLIGNGYTVSVSNANSALIGTSTGTVSDLCVNGAKIATNNNGTYSNCVAIINGITGYVGNTGTTYTSLAKLASVMSGTFGLDMTNANSSLVPVTQNNKVYEVSYYALSSKNTKQTKFLNVRSGSLVGTTKPTLAANEFLIIESKNTNTDITEKNVIEFASSGYVCNNCYLTDASEFYSPVDFVAANLNYSRTFSADVWSSLVLPFDVNSTVLNKIGVSRVNEFDSFNNGNVSFSAANEIEAYKPYIIKTTSSGTVFANLTNVSVSKSSGNMQKIGSNGYFFGNLGSRLTVAVLANNDKYRVFGFNKNNQMARGTGNAYFDAFRCYLIAPESEFTSSSEAKIRVQFLDKYGNVVDNDATTDVDIVKSNNISVVGGNNEIIVNSDKEQSVSVYTTNGKLVQVADVAEGENVISVNPGMYIVNGKKVIVK